MALTYVNATVGAGKLFVSGFPIHLVSIQFLYKTIDFHIPITLSKKISITLALSCILKPLSRRF